MQTDLDTLNAFLRSAPFMVDLGAEGVAIAPGRVTLALRIAPRHLQHTGQVHAGVLTTLADHAMGSAAQTIAPPAHWVVTAELKSSLLRAAKGIRLVCEAWVIKPGRTLSFTEAEVYAEGDDPAGRRLVMKASATMAVTAASRYE
jgi:uncharacterized protein (TIGR00369 family)